KVLGSKKIVTVYANEIYKQLPKDTSDTPVTVSPYEIIRIPKTKLPVEVMRKQVNVLPDEPEPVDCAKEGERFSKVFKEDYPFECCPGLTEWNSGMDTSLSIAGQCYGTGAAAGSPVGTCINCGNGICEEKEDVCNCPKDCSGGEGSDYATVEDFCDKYWKPSITEMCEGDFSDIMEICIFKDKCTVVPDVEIEVALNIAENSDCVQVGTITENYSYKNGDFWITINPIVEREDCKAFCVVDAESETAESVWECETIAS
ncbi:hypothetical protein KKG83_07985, partial [Candidatus Micrarchaeota archaeon]|nr:hypothetical protein [Candidatus Micrarchaeota archaeon]